MSSATYKKRCAKCKEDLVAKDHFHVDKRNKDGYAGECKECKRKRDAARRAHRREHGVQKKKKVDVQARAYRNALLQLMDRHPDEFSRILKTEIWKLQFKETPEEDRWRSIDDTLV